MLFLFFIYFWGVEFNDCYRFFSERSSHCLLLMKYVFKYFLFSFQKKNRGSLLTDTSPIIAHSLFKDCNFKTVSFRIHRSDIKAKVILHKIL